MERVINKAFDGGPPTQILSEAFRLQIRRSDIATLHGLNWLNDEVSKCTLCKAHKISLGSEMLFHQFQAAFQR